MSNKGEMERVSGTATAPQHRREHHSMAHNIKHDSAAAQKGSAQHSGMAIGITALQHNTSFIYPRHSTLPPRIHTCSWPSSAFPACALLPACLPSAAAPSFAAPSDPPESLSLEVKSARRASVSCKQEKQAVQPCKEHATSVPRITFAFGARSVVRFL